MLADNTSKTENNLSTSKIPDLIGLPPVLGALPTQIYTLGVNPNDGSGIGLILNGVNVPLQTPLNFTQVSNSVYVNGTDVYVVGALIPPYDPQSPQQSSAVVWKNGLIYAQYGTPDSFGTINASAESMIIDNGDLYVVGRDWLSFSKAAVWKNGVETILPSDGNNHCLANSIDVKNSDVCISGLKGNLPALWVNGNIKTLSTVYGSRCSDVVIFGNDAYVVGFEMVNGVKKVAKKWVVNIATNVLTASYLVSFLNESNANSISLDADNNIVYISGTEKRSPLVGGGKRALLWVNNTRTTLSENGYAVDLAVFNGNVYVSGGQNNFGVGIGEQEMNKMWINAIETPYSGAYSHTKSIALN